MPSDRIFRSIHLFNSAIVYIHRRCTSTAVKVLSEPNICNTNGGTFAIRGCAQTKYKCLAALIFTNFCISAVDSAINENEIGTPVFEFNGSTSPTIWFVDGSYSIFKTIPVASSHSHTQYTFLEFQELQILIQLFTSQFAFYHSFFVSVNIGNWKKFESNYRIGDRTNV